MANTPQTTQQQAKQEQEQAQYATNQNQILPDQSHHNPLREAATQSVQEKQDQLDEGDLRDVELDESKLDPQEREANLATKYAPEGSARTHASPAQQKQDQLSLEPHASTAEQAERADKNPQAPRNQQHQAPGSEPLNQVKQQKGIDVLIDNM